MENNKNEQIIVTKTSRKAIASLILSLVIPGIGSILGIILGHIARSEIKKNDGRLTGGGLALAGLIISYLTLGIAVLGIVSAVIVPKLAQ